MYRVRIDGQTEYLGAWEIVVVIDHGERENDVQPCVPVPHELVQRLKHSRRLCEVCRTVRPRKQTWLVRERSTGRKLSLRWI